MRIAASYAILAASWILGSDTVLKALVPSVESFATLGIYKGFAFVAISSFFLYVLIKRASAAEATAHARVQKSEEHLRAVVEHAPVGIFHYGLDLRITYINSRFAEMLSTNESDLLGLDLATLTDTRVLAAIRGVLDGSTERYEGAYRPRLAKTVIWLSMICAPTRDADGAVNGAVGIVEDISERVRADEALRKLSAVVEQGPLSVVITDPEGRIEYVNPQFCATTGYSRDEVLGKNPSVTKSKETAPELYATLWTTIKAGKPWRGVFRNRRKDGSLYWEDAVVTPVRDETGQITHFAGIKQDITDRMEAEAQLEFSANHDALTGLPNQLLARDRLERALSYAERRRRCVGLLLLDLDNFKAVNDGLGHSGGDALLKLVAARLLESVRDTDTVSRQGGDEFLLVLSDVDDGEALAPLALKILERLAEPFQLDGHEVSVSGSVGISVYPSDGNKFESLLRKADMAMYHAKQSGRNTYRFFDDRMNVDAEENLKMRAGLTRALNRAEFLLHYQPQLDLATGRIIGAEALIRWDHPERGLLAPGGFIPVAESSGLVVPMGAWCVGEACRQAAEWQRVGLDVVVGVNLSALQFRRDDLVETVKEALNQSQLKPGLLELELTESMLINDTEAVLQTLRGLKALGVKLSIDDFGTGYSSLAYLRRFDVDRLKIDKSFVQDIVHDLNARAIVRGVINLARSLDLRTVAEGVEDEITFDWLRDHGCDEMQGYFLARPMPGEQLLTFLADHRQEAWQQAREEGNVITGGEKHRQNGAA